MIFATNRIHRTQYKLISDVYVTVIMILSELETFSLDKSLLCQRPH